MKKTIICVCAAATILLATGSAFADSIKGRIGVTGKIGFLIPSDGDYGPSKYETDAGLTGGAGVIYGIDDHFAAELEITRSSFDSTYGDFGVTDLSLGAQYRLVLSQPKLVPYLGGGLDVLFSDVDHGGNIDTTFGVHATAGVDYFILKQLAVTAEAKLLVAPEVDIHNSGSKVGTFDPTSFSTTIGVRYFFN